MGCFCILCVLGNIKGEQVACMLHSYDKGSLIRVLCINSLLIYVVLFVYVIRQR